MNAMAKSGWNLGWLALAAALLVPGAGSAQQWGAPGCDRPGCGRMGGAGARGFDPKALTTVQGQILEVRRVARGRHEGVHLAVATGAQTLVVHLGPSFYVDAQPVTLAKGDAIEVKGARATLGGEEVLLAQEVRRGVDVLALRDADGIPLWRGQGRGWR